MKLIIIDHADPSVGMFAQTWEVDCPFTKESADENELATFKLFITIMYEDWCEGKIEANYDFEYKEMEEAEAKWQKEIDDAEETFRNEIENL